MRKLEQKIVRAINFGENKSIDNTFVKHDRVIRNGQEVREWSLVLHGNCIAHGVSFQVRPTEINLCGWGTATTASRIRALGVDLRKKGGVWYIDGEEIRDSGWFPVKSEEVA